MSALLSASRGVGCALDRGSRRREAQEEQPPQGTPRVVPEGIREEVKGAHDREGGHHDFDSRQQPGPASATVFGQVHSLNLTHRQGVPAMVSWPALQTSGSRHVQTSLSAADECVGEALRHPTPRLRAQTIDPRRSTDVVAVTTQSRLSMRSIGAPMSRMLPKKSIR